MELTISLPPSPDRVSLTGPAERNLKIIREALGVRISARNGHLRICGDSTAVSRAGHLVEQLASAARRSKPMNHEQLIDAIVTTNQSSSPVIAHSTSDPLTADSLDVYLAGRRVKALTDGQRRYLQAILSNDLTLCCGPAGTGKTYLAVAAAVSMLRHGQMRRLVLVRPAVEAGEKLGFLPGDMQDKVNPYLRPLLDALNDMIEFDQIQRFMSNDVIEVIPLAFMRGRTLKDSVIILDEAQNTTSAQMLMFLTRMGHGAKLIVTGDTTQIDLDDPSRSGLVDAARRLRSIKNVAMITLEPADIVRHSLVQKIVEAYGREPTSTA